MIQKSLFQNDGKETKFIPAVPIAKVQVSPLNPRRTWNEKHVEAIAQHIERSGYDNTQAIKCHLSADGVYLVFAGSNRLKAAQKLGYEVIPVFLYEGYTDEEIWRMAYDDNEQAEAQAQFSMVDVWMDYKAKSEAGWKQQKIADVLGVDRSQVARRLQYAEFPDLVKYKFVDKPILNERHARELLDLWTVHIFSNETLLCEIIDNVLSRTKEPTSAQFKAEVEKYNEAIKAAQEWQGQLNDPYLAKFIESISDKRTAAAINAQGRKYYDEQTQAQARELQEKLNQLSKQEAETKAAKEKAEKEKKKQQVLDRIMLGDSRELVKHYPDEIKLVFTDPPYGKDFQSNRRTASAKAEKISSDEDIKTALQLTKDVLAQLVPKMAENSAVLLWCDWLYEPEFRDLLKDIGFALKNSIVWKKKNHGTGDLYGSFAPKHERLLFAVKGRPVFTEAGRLPDVLEGYDFLPTEHPTPKPLDLIGNIIESLTEENEIVVDPFGGCGSVAVPAISKKRVFYSSEISEKWHEESLNYVSQILENGY